MKALLLVLCSLPAWATITRIQPATSGSTTQGVCSSSSAVTSEACSFTSTPTVGNLIVIWCSAATTQTWTTPTDNQSGNTYNNVAAATGNQAGSTDVSIGLWWSIVSGSTGTFTVTCKAGTTAFLTALVMEYSGVVSSSPVDTSAGAGGTCAPCTGGTPMSPGSITTTNANDVIIGACSVSNGGSGTATFTAATGFTIQNQQTNDSSFQPAASQDQIVSVATNYTASMQFSINSSDNYRCGVAAFKASGTNNPVMPPSIR